MIERVARALCQASKTPPIYPQEVDRDWPDFADLARVAIEAMREPDAAMKAAGGEFFEEGALDDNGRAAAIVYGAMIEAALAGKAK